MNKSIKILQNKRKIIAITLLLNFLFSNILFAFPPSKCDGMCSFEVELHKCSDMVEMTCCDIMGNNNTLPRKIEFTDNSCDYITNIINDFTFIIPKSVDTKLDFSEFRKITIRFVEKTSTSFVLMKSIIYDTSSPIYISISSYLI